MALRDPCSHANIDQIITKSLHLDLTACFERKELSGYARLHLQATQDGVDKVVLDTRNLNIGAVATADGVCFPYQLSGEDALGSALTITLNEPLAKGAELQLRVDYTTSPEAAGIQWLEPVQTEGKQHPYLFTQFQAIHCRSGVPCQDTPAVKIPYTASMTVPKPLTALMSALSTDSTPNEDGTTTFRFSQPVPIPTYLIAFVIGHLESREIGPRSRVWAEPGVVEKAEYEFSADTETYLKIAEDLLIPYEWGRYDMVCLPGSFPYGGMENPCLTFVTPTLLAGDRSLTSVVAHEIAHSWTGNLVTNRTWEHFWLNEGFTVFVERKILGRMYGEPFRQFEFINGWKSLKDSVDLYGVEHNFTTLLPKLDGIDPDDAFSSVPYERGSEFLFYLEQHVGAALFEPFLRQWINDNKYGTVTTDLFRDFFQSYFQDKVSADVLKSLDWEGWLHKPGMPPVDLLGSFDDSLAAKTKQLAHQWLSDPATTGSKDDFSSSDLTVDFLNRLELGGTKGVLSKELLERLDASYSFTASRNAEIRMQWYTLCLLSGYEPIFPHVVQFLSEQGRMKYVRPLYRMLYNSSAAGKELALTTFDRLKDTYHNIAKKMIQSDLNKLQEQSH